MGVLRDEILAYLHDLLDLGHGSDYGPNGLQVEGRQEVSRVALGVSASLALFREAHDADLIVVHHGLWFGPLERLTGVVAERVRFLMARNISLAAYHLPLDRHPRLGNNAVLCRHLGVPDPRPFGEVRGSVIALLGELPAPTPVSVLAGRLAEACRQEPGAIAFGPSPVTRVAVVTGAGADLMEEAAGLGAELFVTGEVAERGHEVARELGLTVLAAGHYASERFGVQALADDLRERFDVETRFIDVENPL